MALIDRRTVALDRAITLPAVVSHGRFAVRVAVLPGPLGFRWLRRNDHLWDRRSFPTRSPMPHEEITSHG